MGFLLVYTRAVTKRLVEIDDDVLAAARVALGTATIKETVQRALQDAAATSLRRAFLERAVADGLADLRDPAVDAWR
jgi:Arc/MetJ family transcription regulator